MNSTTLHDQVYAALAQAFMSGAFRPGETLSYQKLAAHFGVSPMPVRDALRRLAAEGAVDIAPKRGVRVPLANAERLDELTHVRIALEGLATFRAAGHLGPAQLSDLHRLAEEIAQAGDRDDARGYLAGNHQFHFAIYRAAGSGLTLRLIEGLWLQTGPLMTGFEAEAMRGEPTLHHEIVDALTKSDAKRAKQLMQRDIEHGMAAIRSRLE